MSAKDYRFLSVENVLLIHDDTIGQEGGKRGLRDNALLESAVAMPQSALFGEYLHPGLSGKAAAYLFHLCQNHPFSDGNKRTAVLSLLLFLTLNGIPNDALPPEEDLERVTFAIASNQMTKDQIIEWFRSLRILCYFGEVIGVRSGVLVKNGTPSVLSHLIRGKIFDKFPIWP